MVELGDSMSTCHWHNRDLCGCLVHTAYFNLIPTTLGSVLSDKNTRYYKEVVSIRTLHETVTACHHYHVFYFSGRVENAMVVKFASCQPENGEGGGN